MSLVRVSVQSGENLASADANGFSDPYVLVYAGKQKKKTKTQKKTLNPTWNETFTINVKGVTEFRFECHDWDAIGKDDFLGEAIVPLKEIELDGKPNTFALQARDSIKTEHTISGNIIVSFAEPPKSGTVEKLPSNVINEIKDRIKKAMAAKAMELDLSTVGLAKLPNAVPTNLNYITELDLSFNNFEEWPDLSAFDKLQKLNLSGNRLQVMDTTVSKLTSLQELYINGNAIEKFPSAFGEMRCLEKLDASNNQLMELPAQIGRLTKLEELLLTGNQISGLPMDIGECEGLEVVDLSCCTMESVPEQFCYCTRLMELNLGNNQLTKLPETIGRLTRLVVLNVSDNNIEDLPLTLGYCKGLGKLGAGINISRNPIKSEKMLEKWRIGTDHLVSFLEVRLDAVGKPPVHDVTRSTINGRHADGTAGSALAGSGVASGGAAAAAPAAAADTATAVEAITTTMNDKLKTLSDWGNRVVQEELKPSFTSVKYDVTQLAAVEDAILYAKFVRELKEDCDKTRSMMPDLAAAPAPQIGATDDKLTKLRAGLVAAVCDVIIVINGLQRNLQSGDEKTMVKSIQLIKSIKTKLDSFMEKQGN